MLFRTKLWIVIAIICMELSAYDIQVVQANEPNELNEVHYLLNEAKLASYLTEGITHTDPEAADILRYCLTDPNVEDLAIVAEKYPNNEFFLAQLTYQLTDVNLIDPRAVIALADRLIAMNPGNAHYHYIKACILLKMPGDRDKINAALEQFKKGNDLPEFTLPYSAYKPRIEMLCEKAGMGILQKRRAIPSETGWYWDIGFSISRSRGCYPKLALDSFRTVSAELSKAADNVIRHAKTFGSLEAGYIHLFSTEWMRLRELDLTKEQARQVRYRLCRAIEINDKLQQFYDEMLKSFPDGKLPESDSISSLRPLPEATRETYEHVLSEKHSSDPNAPVRPFHKEDAGLPKNLYLASPEDLSAIIHERDAAGHPIRDKLLWEIMSKGGHDIRPIVLKALKNPNAPEVLLRRAKWKDVSVKRPLEEMFEEKMNLLAQTLASIRKDPNSIESLIIGLFWNTEGAKEKLEQMLNAKMDALSERVQNTQKTKELRNELKLLLKMDHALGGMNPEDYDLSEQMLRAMERSNVPTHFFESDPDPMLTLRKKRDRSSRIRQMIIDANMPELFEDDSDTHVNVPGYRLVESLLSIAGALAFLSEPDEVKARFSRILQLAGEGSEESVSTRSRKESLLPLISPSTKIQDGRLWWEPLLFYRSLWGVPRMEAADLLKDYLIKRRLADPFEEDEFADVLRTSGDRELAEWVVKQVAESPPKIEKTYYTRDVPNGQTGHASKVSEKIRLEDEGYRFLEAAFVHLNAGSIPLLIGHLDSDDAPLRAFIVWRLTSLGYDWPSDKRIEVTLDGDWKVRLNILWSLDENTLVGAVKDKNPIVRVIAKILLNGVAS